MFVPTASASLPPATNHTAPGVLRIERGRGGGAQSTGDALRIRHRETARLFAHGSRTRERVTALCRQHAARRTRSACPGRESGSARAPHARPPRRSNHIPHTRT
jgi:hypothetical protein